MRRNSRRHPRPRPMASAAAELPDEHLSFLFPLQPLAPFVIAPTSAHTCLAHLSDFCAFSGLAVDARRAAAYTVAGRSPQARDVARRGAPDRHRTDYSPLFGGNGHVSILSTRRCGSFPQSWSCRAVIRASPWPLPYPTRVLAFALQPARYEET